jgi:hypothetical protein
MGKIIDSLEKAFFNFQWDLVRLFRSEKATEIMKVYKEGWLFNRMDVIGRLTNGGTRLLLPSSPLLSFSCNNLVQAVIRYVVYSKDGPSGGAPGELRVDFMLVFEELISVIKSIMSKPEVPLVELTQMKLSMLYGGQRVEIVMDGTPGKQLFFLNAKQFSQRVNEALGKLSEKNRETYSDLWSWNIRQQNYCIPPLLKYTDKAVVQWAGNELLYLSHDEARGIPFQVVGKEFLMVGKCGQYNIELGPAYNMTFVPRQDYLDALMLPFLTYLSNLTIKDVVFTEISLVNSVIGDTIALNSGVIYEADSIESVGFTEISSFSGCASSISSELNFAERKEREADGKPTTLKLYLKPRGGGQTRPMVVQGADIPVGSDLSQSKPVLALQEWLTNSHAIPGQLVNAIAVPVVFVGAERVWKPVEACEMLISED